ncbi:amidase [Mesorhizobium sp. M0977]|uniref:amidase n=1 Tax=Mesorhizobium sp. M0977 TaxID=2957039 RepID=UPI00333B8911
MQPYEMTAAEAARAIRNKTLSALELVDSLLDRIARVERRIRAWVHVDAQGARCQAKVLADEAIRGRFRGLLHGVPFAAKDIFYSEGLPTEGGSKVLKGFIPTYNATTVARLQAAGAILLGKTHTTEFAVSDPAPTRNPWNRKHSPGGSSTRSAAAVAAAMVPLALGSQTGGSNLRPASFCGLAGLKASFGRVSLHGVLPLSWSLDHVGFMARSVEDLGLLLQATAGFDPQDLSSSAEPIGSYAAAAVEPGRPPRIGVLRRFFFDTTIAHAEVVTVVDAAVKQLKAAGAPMCDAELPQSFFAIHAAHFVSEESELADAHADFYAMKRHLYRPLMRQSVELGFLIPGDLHVRAHRIRRQFRREITEVLRDFDVLVMPTSCTTAPPTIKNTGDWKFQSPWSASGLPSMTLPCGLSPAGLPVGLQLVGAPFAEEKLLRAGAWCETVLGRGPLTAL